MTPPDFWYNPTRSPPVFLRMLSWVYAVARYLHVTFTRPARPPIHTICVGNITAGGSGKTPIVRALRALLSDYPSAVLLRGYGGTEQGPIQVTPDHSPRIVGDESLIHATDGITYIAHNRFDGLKTIQTDMPTTRLVILDDGLQNRHVTATLNILVIDGTVGFGNGYLIPAGPLREPIHAALDRIHLCIIIGPDQTNVVTTVTKYKPDMPIITAHLIPDTTYIDPTKRYIAVAGIGRPQKFYDTLKSLGLDIVATQDFNDHHTYRKPDVNALFESARGQNAIIITTEKDAVKIRALTDIPFAVLPVRAVFDNPDDVRRLIRSGVQ